MRDPLTNVCGTFTQTRGAVANAVEAGPGMAYSLASNRTGGTFR